MKNVIAKRIKSARKQADLTQQELSDRMGFKDRQTVTAIEAGSRKVSADELLAVMKVLGRDLEYFTDPLRLEGEGSFSWRTSAENVEQLGEFESWAGGCLALYRHLTAGEDVWTVPLRLSLTSKSSYEDAHRAAEWLADEWKLGDVPADLLEEAIDHRLRALVLYVDAPEGISGAAVKIPGLSAILINRNEPTGRRSFDLAHELFHLLTWETIRPEHFEIEKVTGPMKRREQLANCFASALLMPEDVLREWWEQAPHDDQDRWFSWVQESSNKLRVSSPALQWRLVQLGLLEKDAVDDSEQLGLIHDSEEERRPRFSRVFIAVLGQGLEEGRISVRRASSVVGMRIDDLADLFREHKLEVPFEI